jgi:UDP-N-acetylglucosamine/UDP-N-acetylgalactosamine diphosphorylase
MLDQPLLDQIERTGQGHLLQFWSELSVEAQDRFAKQLADIDWDLISGYRQDAGEKSLGGDFHVRDAIPPTHVVRFPVTANEQIEWDEARLLGESALASGRVGAVLLAGGHGTRLGFKHSKGLFPISPVTQKSLLEIFASQILAVSKKFGHTIPYFIMTSEGNHAEIESFFRKHHYFGLNSQDLFFFHQGFAPSLDLQTGKILLASKGALSLSPDGHGGIFAALWKAGLFEEMRKRGVDYLFSHQVDNPLVKVCDPDFIGQHIRHQSEVSTKVVAKMTPDEKVGIAVNLGGHTRIVEYSDLPSDLANARDSNGNLRFWAGNTAIHLFNRSFLERVATDHSELPWHRAIKKLPYIDREGNRITASYENGVKFERFIFDTMPLAKVALIIETLRDEEFAPLKNQQGEFSPEYVRQKMIARASSWLAYAGITPPADAMVEISPFLAMSATELRAHRAELANVRFDQPQYLSPVSRENIGNAEGQSDSARVAPFPKITEPLVFDSFCRPQVWGGRYLGDVLGHHLPARGPYGEAWDLSSQPLHESRVIEGPFAGRSLSDLWTHFGRELVGREPQGAFPLLLKWLECRELLSVQVHPDDEMARRVLREPYGKSEAWVVIFAEPTARIYAGLRPQLTREDVVFHLNAGTLHECLHSFVPKVGDCISIPAGTIHAAGGGLVLAEVQQSSDATFRLFDWNRLGFDGKHRPLQIDRALDAIDWNQGPVSPIIPAEVIGQSFAGAHAETLVEGNGFRLERYTVHSQLMNPHPGELTIWMVLAGKFHLSLDNHSYSRQFDQGSSVMIPASVNGAVWKTQNERGQNERGSSQLLCIRLRLV